MTVCCTPNPDHVAFKNVTGIVDEIEPAFIGDVAVERCLDVIPPAKETMLASLTNDRGATGAGNEVQVSVLGFDRGGAKDQICHEVV